MCNFIFKRTLRVSMGQGSHPPPQPLLAKLGHLPVLIPVAGNPRSTPFNRYFYHPYHVYYTSYILKTCILTYCVLSNVHFSPSVNFFFINCKQKNITHSGCRIAYLGKFRESICTWPKIQGSIVHLFWVKYTFAKVQGVRIHVFKM